MEIIEHGNTYKTFTCTYCGCVFAACRRDVYWSEYLQYGCVKCPECGEEIEVKGIM